MHIDSTVLVYVVRVNVESTLIVAFGWQQMEAAAELSLQALQHLAASFTSHNATLLLTVGLQQALVQNRVGQFSFTLPNMGQARVDVHVSKAQQQSVWLFAAISSLDGNIVQVKGLENELKEQSMLPGTTAKNPELELSSVMTVWMMSFNRLKGKGRCIGHPIIQTWKYQDGSVEIPLKPTRNQVLIQV